MMEEPEDDRLDQSLRDTFSDFDLPPSGHIWSGIEGHLSAMPGPPRKVPLLLLLPAVGLVGVAVGWLLPHPTEPTPNSQPAVTTQAPARPDPQPTKELTAYKAPQLPPASQPIHAVPVVSASPVAKRVRPVLAASVDRKASATAIPEPIDSATGIAATQPVVAEVPVVYTAPVATEPSPAQVVPSSQLENSALVTPPTEATNLRLRDTAGSAHSKYAAELPKQSFKNESLREWRPEYRVPKHRLEERGGRLRRIRNSITKHWQHLFGPRRAGQPAS
ncbi:hypothetical protein J0X19_03195 [Hymenobacter sp. BT186]|uniref:Uncharacterized protein n=1 Tax=Hymenobacter telluris TaxID=2816474 RepID=A0A939ESY1_9BACT|nr:hypothetical protein [Hymenobacter telluris]MBO0356940.1 hypothetical protein [Hymenobacter telluris]MBW3372967.1 hypothetical protein [Hymenobacter norwichensis]